MQIKSSTWNIWNTAINTGELVCKWRIKQTIKRENLNKSTTSAHGDELTIQKENGSSFLHHCNKVYQPTGHMRTSDQCRVKLRVTDKIDDLQLIKYTLKKKVPQHMITADGNWCVHCCVFNLLLWGSSTCPALQRTTMKATLPFTFLLHLQKLSFAHAALRLTALHARGKIINKKVQIVCFGYLALIFFALPWGPFMSFPAEDYREETLDLQPRRAAPAMFLQVDEQKHKCWFFYISGPT